MKSPVFFCVLVIRKNKMMRTTNNKEKENKTKMKGIPLEKKFRNQELYPNCEKDAS